MTQSEIESIVNEVLADKTEGSYCVRFILKNGDHVCLYTNHQTFEVKNKMIYLYDEKAKTNDIFLARDVSTISTCKRDF